MQIVTEEYLQARQKIELIDVGPNPGLVTLRLPRGAHVVDLVRTISDQHSSRYPSGPYGAGTCCD